MSTLKKRQEEANKLAKQADAYNEATLRGENEKIKSDSYEGKIGNKTQLENIKMGLREFCKENNIPLTDQQVDSIKKGDSYKITSDQKLSRSEGWLTLSTCAMSIEVSGMTFETEGFTGLSDEMRYVQTHGLM